MVMNGSSRVRNGITAKTASPPVVCKLGNDGMAGIYKKCTALFISMQQITDISPLISLPCLEVVDIKNNPVKDISSLRELKFLKREYIKCGLAAHLFWFCILFNKYVN